MSRLFTALWVLFLFSLPLWMDNQYVLHVLIVTGIFCAGNPRSPQP